MSAPGRKQAGSSLPSTSKVAATLGKATLSAAGDPARGRGAGLPAHGTQPQGETSGAEGKGRAEPLVSAPRDRIQGTEKGIQEAKMTAGPMRRREHDSLKDVGAGGTPAHPDSSAFCSQHFAAP